MAWVIASIPFWALGFFFFPLGAVAALVVKDPGETITDQTKQALGSTFVGGALLLLAARICS